MALTTPLWANNALTTLAAAITNSQTTLSLSSGSGALFPQPTLATQFFPLTLNSATSPGTLEIVYVTGRSGDTLTVVRAQEGTAGLAFNAGDLAQNLLTAGTVLMLEVVTQNVQYFTGPGTFSVPAAVTSVYVRAFGAGAGGGGSQSGAAGGGGGGGGYAEGAFQVTPGANYTVTVGAGGAGGAGGTGNVGSNSSGGTSFGSFITINVAAGGSGATTGNLGAGGASGTVSASGGLALQAGNGTSGNNSGAVYLGGNGGNAFGVGPNPGSLANGASGGISQGGAGGANGGGGGAGGNGLVIVSWAT